MFWLRNKKNSFQLRTLSLRPVFLQRRYAKMDMRSACTFVFRSMVWLNQPLLKSIMTSNEGTEIIGSTFNSDLTCICKVQPLLDTQPWSKTETFQSQSAPKK